MTLRAVVIGTGAAAEGHTIALRGAGVEVVAICGRTPEPAKAMAEKLGVPDLCFDWRQAIDDVYPDIVAITTPGAPHYEMAEYAAGHQCHVACEKPLALSAADAKSMLVAVEKANVKHAYAATGCFAPVMMQAQKLLSEGLIGQVRETELIMHMNTSLYQPYHWFHQLDQGGGWLYQGLTHFLTVIASITGARVVAASGEARRLIERAPVGPTLHDFREFSQAAMEPEKVEEWREVNSDSSFTVMTQLEIPDAPPASALFQLSSRAVNHLPNYLAFYGTSGTLQLNGPFFSDQMQHYSHETEAWQEIPIPESGGSDVRWAYFYRQFVADIQGKDYAAYPTFHDGWIANEIIEIVQRGDGWTVLPSNPPNSE
jgi:predicted dehydrogenase